MFMQGLQRCTAAKFGHPGGYVSAIALVRLLANARARTSHKADGGGEGVLSHGCACSAPFAPLRMSAARCNTAACTGNAMPFAHPLVNTLRTNTPHAASVHHDFARACDGDATSRTIKGGVRRFDGDKSTLKQRAAHCLQSDRALSVGRRPPCSSCCERRRRRPWARWL